MGNHKFRLSDILPNAWFYKLRDMSKTKNHKASASKKKSPSSTMQKSHFSQPRSSFYYAAESIRVDKFYNNSPANLKPFNSYFPDPPRRSSAKRRSKRKTIYKPSPKHIPSSLSIDDKYSTEEDSSFQELNFLKSTSSEFESDSVADHASQSFNALASWSSSCSCQFSSSTTDIIIDMNDKIHQTKEFDKLDDTISELDLPPILTKLAKSNHTELAHLSIPIKISKEESIKTRREKEHTQNSAPRKSISQSTGVKLRANSPKIASKKIQGHGRKSVSSNSRSRPKRKSFSAGSFAIVKASFDPQKDFSESMMEMIVENNIKASQDLEDLLACYLSLNSDEYHDIIIKAFEQIWFNFPDLHL